MSPMVVSQFLCLVLLVACGTSATPTRSSNAVTLEEPCPPWVSESKVRIVYGPGNAMAIWEGPTESLEHLRFFVSGVATHFSHADAAPGRVVRYEPQKKGAAIIVDDTNTERLDKLRADFEQIASEVNEGSCDTMVSMLAPPLEPGPNLSSIR